MNKLITKNSLAVTRISSELLIFEVGDRIPRIEDFSKDIGVGRGTIQKAIDFIQSEGALSLQSNGHMGTYILSMDKKKLWNIAGFTSILGTMPLPYSRRYEGLATALCMVFENADIPFNIAYQRGASSRISGVLNGRYDFAVCSRLAATEAIKQFGTLEIALGFGNHSFVSGHTIIVRDGIEPKISDGMRVAIDSNSIDQKYMTEYFCKNINVEFVECPYNQLIQKLRNAEIDASIWNADELEERFPSLKQAQLELPSDIELLNTEAVLVTNSQKRELLNIFKEVILIDEVVKIQKKVMHSEVLPKY